MEPNTRARRHQQKHLYLFLKLLVATTNQNKAKRGTNAQNFHGLDHQKWSRMGSFFHRRHVSKPWKLRQWQHNKDFCNLNQSLACVMCYFVTKQNLTLSCNARENTKQLNTQPRKIWTSNECVRLSKVADLLVSSKFSSVDFFRWRFVLQSKKFWFSSAGAAAATEDKSGSI